jgi:hypothetical protein
MWNTPEFNGHLEEALKEGSVAREFEMKVDVPKAGRKNIRVTVSPLGMKNILPARIMILFEER